VSVEVQALDDELGLGWYFLAEPAIAARSGYSQTG
jgi:hypothetical protein